MFINYIHSIHFTITKSLTTCETIGKPIYELTQALVRPVAETVTSVACSYALEAASAYISHQDDRSYPVTLLSQALFSVLTGVVVIQLVARCVKRPGDSDSSAEDPGDTLPAFEHDLSDDTPASVSEFNEAVGPHKCSTLNRDFGALNDTIDGVQDVIPGLTFDDSITDCSPQMTKLFRQQLHALFTPKAVDAMHTREYLRAGALMPDIISRAIARRDDGELDFEALCTDAAIDLLLTPGDYTTLKGRRVKLSKQCMDARGELNLPVFLKLIYSMTGKIEGTLVHKMHTKGFSKRAIKMTLFVIFSVATENTHNLLQGASLIAQNDPALRLQAHKEINSLIQEGCEPHEAYRQSEAVKSIIAKSMLTQPPVSTIERKTARGTITLPIDALTEDPEVREQASQCHDSHGNVTMPKHWPDVAWKGFGHGTHICPGWRQSQAVVHQCIGYLVHHYQFNPKWNRWMALIRS